MDIVTTEPAMRERPRVRNAYWVCFPQRDGLESLRGEFAEARKKFFTGGRKAVKVGKSETVKGFDGRLWGKLTRRNLFWKKTANKVEGSRDVALEEAFDRPEGHLLVTRDLRGVIVSRVFFDRQMLWVKSEYYEPWDPANARVVFQPGEETDRVERLDWNAETKEYRTTLLYPTPYLPGTAKQSILNARFGEPRLIVSAAEGEFCYCPKQEAEERLKAMEDLNEGTIVLMPAWEVREGAVPGEDGDEPGLSFTSLEEYAKIEAPAEALTESQTEEAEEAASGLPEEKPWEPEAEPPAEGIAEPAPEAVSQTPGSALDTEAILAAARRAAEPAARQETEPSEEAPDTGNAPAASAETALAPAVPADGHGRTQQANGLTVYDGEFQNGMRHGFGSSYYKDGSLGYAGFWKDDKKDGMGVSFRETDHALHVSRWQEGKPEGFVSLFDKEGSLRFSGRIEDGKKQGAGVSIDSRDGTVFVGKWIDGENTGIGSAFDRDGALLYYGAWKDGKRHGQGTEFDKNGAIVFDGEWKDGKYHNGILYQKLKQEEQE